VTEQERKDEFWAAKTEADGAARDLRCLAARIDRYRAKMEYVQDSMREYLTDEPTGINNHPDLSGWPTQSDIVKLFGEFYKARRVLYNARRRMEQF